jgi:hypothetical protein
VSRKLHFHQGIIGLALALLFIVGGHLSAQTGGTIAYGQSVDGSTANGGTENWSFTGSAGDLVVISMTSTEFDTYLELRDPDGQVIIADDDGGQELNSRIIRTLQANGSYTITAGGFGDERGTYTLTLANEAAFGESVQSALAQANIAPGDGFVADGMFEVIIDLTEEDETVEWDSLDGEYADFAMGAEINWGPGATEDTCGFIFRRLDEDNYYVVEIDRTGGVWYVERSGGEWGEVQGDSYLAVRTGSKDTNQLVLSAIGDTFIVYVNGQRTVSFSDDSNTSGEVAVEMSTFDESTVTNCTFNDVWVWDLGASPGAAPTPDTPPTQPGPDTQPTKTPVPPTEVSEATSATLTINVPSANLRSGPGTDFERVESASAGDTFPVIGRSGEGQDTWYMVSLSGDRQGWLWSGIVTLSPADAVIPVVEGGPSVPTTNQSPVISSIVSQGTCEDLTLVVNWSDPNSDAVRIEWLDTDTGDIAFTDDISGGGGSFSSTDWFCETDSCVTNARVVDAAGNMSNTYEATTTCS